MACGRPFPSKETGRIFEMDPGLPVVPGGKGIGLGCGASAPPFWEVRGPEGLRLPFSLARRDLGGDLGGPETVCSLLCVAKRRATRPNG